MRISRGVVALAALVALAACSSDAESIPSGPDVTFATPTTPDGTGADTTAPATSSESDGDTTAAPTAPTAPTEPTESTAPAETAASTAPITTEQLGDPEPLPDPVVALVPVTRAASPVDLAFRTGDPSPFVVEQFGTIRRLVDGTLGDPVLNIFDQVTAGGEQGLLGLTFNAEGTLAYVDFTDAENADTHIVEYAVDADGVFDESSARELLVIEQPYGNHNGGNVTIGPDGYLYIGMGDGGDGGDPQRRALNVSTHLGKILRIDPTPSGDQPYTIPADNPFVDVDGALPEIWSVGVRNPWRMTFDRETGDLWFGDVGQGEWEEIDVAWADEGGGRGVNWGWSAFEGTHRFNEDQSPDGAVPPIFEYEHGDAGCSISGGAVYRGAAIPALVGWYVYADYCSGLLFGIKAEVKQLVGMVELGQSSEISAVREGPDGELYVLSLQGPITMVTPAG